jgi:hypothetical protein
MENHQADLITAAVRAVTAKLLAARITMYTINPIAGSAATVDVQTPDDLHMASSDIGPEPFGQGTVNFRDLAPSTGGTAFQGRNDLNNVIAEGIAHGDEYYTLSYSPTDKSDDPAKFRHIVVTMKDPALRATTRDGYFPETAADINPLMDKSIDIKQKKRDIQLDLSQALTATISYNGLDIKATKAKDGTYTVHVGEKGLTWSDPAEGTEHSEATVAAGWYDSKGKLVAHVADEQTCVRATPGSGATFTVVPANVPSNSVRIRFVIRDALSGRMGTADIKSSM